MSVIQILSLVNGEPTPFDRQFIVEFDASRPNGSGHADSCHLVTTPNLDGATHYEVEDAIELWRSVDQRNPVRDGAPNRPLAAFHVAVLDV